MNQQLNEKKRIARVGKKLSGKEKDNPEVDLVSKLTESMDLMVKNIRPQRSSKLSTEQKVLKNIPSASTGAHLSGNRMPSKYFPDKKPPLMAKCKKNLKYLEHNRSVPKQRAHVGSVLVSPKKSSKSLTPPEARDKPKKVKIRCNQKVNKHSNRPVYNSSELSRANLSSDDDHVDEKKYYSSPNDSDADFEYEKFLKENKSEQYSSKKSSNSKKKVKKNHPELTNCSTSKVLTERPANKSKFSKLNEDRFRPNNTNKYRFQLENKVEDSDDDSFSESSNFSESDLGCLGFKQKSKTKLNKKKQHKRKIEVTDGDTLSESSNFNGDGSRCLGYKEKKKIKPSCMKRHKRILEVSDDDTLSESSNMNVKESESITYKEKKNNPSGKKQSIDKDVETSEGQQFNPNEMFATDADKTSKYRAEPSLNMCDTDQNDNSASELCWKNTLNDMDSVSTNFTSISKYNNSGSFLTFDLSKPKTQKHISDHFTCFVRIERYLPLEQMVSKSSNVLSSDSENECTVICEVPKKEEFNVKIESVCSLSNDSQIDSMLSVEHANSFKSHAVSYEISSQETKDDAPAILVNSHSWSPSNNQTSITVNKSVKLEERRDINNLTLEDTLSQIDFAAINEVIRKNKSTESNHSVTSYKADINKSSGDPESQLNSSRVDRVPSIDEITLSCNKQVNMCDDVVRLNILETAKNIDFKGILSSVKPEYSHPPNAESLEPNKIQTLLKNEQLWKNVKEAVRENLSTSNLATLGQASIKSNSKISNDVPVVKKLNFETKREINAESPIDELDVLATASIRGLCESQPQSITPLFHLYTMELDHYAKIVSAEKNVSDGMKMLEETQYRKLKHLETAIHNLVMHDPCYYKVAEESALSKTAKSASSDVTVVKQDLKGNSMHEKDLQSPSPNTILNQGTSRRVIKCDNCCQEAKIRCNDCMKVNFCSEKCGLEYWINGHDKQSDFRRDSSQEAEKEM